MFTQSVQIIFSVLLQHHISRLSMYFLSLFQCVQVVAPYTAMLQMQHFASFFLKFKYGMLVSRVFALYSILWVIPRRQSFLCRRFGTLFLLHRSFKQEEYLGRDCWDIYTTRQKFEIKKKLLLHCRFPYSNPCCLRYS